VPKAVKEVGKGLHKLPKERLGEAATMRKSRSEETQRLGKNSGA
jgi:hypothetical protein